MLNQNNYNGTKLICRSFEEMYPTRLEWIPSLKKTCRVPDYTKQQRLIMPPPVITPVIKNF